MQPHDTVRCIHSFSHHHYLLRKIGPIPLCRRRRNIGCIRFGPLRLLLAPVPLPRTVRCFPTEAVRLRQPAVKNVMPLQPAERRKEQRATFFPARDPAATPRRNLQTLHKNHVRLLQTAQTRELRRPPRELPTSPRRSACFPWPGSVAPRVRRRGARGTVAVTAAFMFHTECL